MKKWLAGFLLLGLFCLFNTFSPLLAKDLVQIGGNIVVNEGERVKDAVAIGGNVTVNGEVEEDVVAVGGSVFLTSRAIVNGDVVAVGGKIEREEGAIIKGEVTELGLGSFCPRLNSLFKTNWRELLLTFRIVTFIGFLALALLLVAVFPRAVELVSRQVEKNLPLTVLWGFLGLALVFPLTLIMAISLVGIIFIPLEFILLCGGLVFGYLAVARLLGRKVVLAFKKPNEPMIWEALLGVILLCLIGLLPVLGFLIKALVGLIGLGAVIMALINLDKKGKEPVESPSPAQPEDLRQTP